MRKAILLLMVLLLLFPTQLFDAKMVGARIPTEVVARMQMVNVEVTKPVRTYYKVELTAYCNCRKCTRTGKGITTSGTRVSKGTIAVPSVIPFGTIFNYQGEQLRAEDRGGAIKVREDGVWVFDVWFPTHQDAKNFGRRFVTMYEENGAYYIE